MPESTLTRARHGSGAKTWRNSPLFRRESAPVELQIVQLREEMRGEFSAVRAEIREGDEETRRSMREGDEETRRYMRVLHEEVIERIATIAERRAGKRR